MNKQKQDSHQEETEWIKFRLEDYINYVRKRKREMKKKGWKPMTKEEIKVRAEATKERLRKEGYKV